MVGTAGIGRARDETVLNRTNSFGVLLLTVRLVTAQPCGNLRTQSQPVVILEPVQVEPVTILEPVHIHSTVMLEPVQVHSTVILKPVQVQPIVMPEPVGVQSIPVIEPVLGTGIIPRRYVCHENG